ncbi:MAG: UMP kinase [Bacilli bacterium]|nr:UMP kinase [Bacilli bacterium]
MINYSKGDVILKYKRIVLKLSGEVLAGKEKSGIDFDRVLELANEIKECANIGYEIAIVVGGGNFWRGKSNEYMDRATSDYIGMLATTMNALALGDAFKQLGVPVRVQTGVEMRQIAEFYIKDRAIRHLEKGRVVIFGCGTGSPFFSTDTASSLRAAEINADILVKATKVDGVYDKDPKKYDDAKKYQEITYIDVLNKKLNVMDSTAISLCMEENIPILVFNILEKGNLKNVLENENIGTLVSEK